MTIAEGSTFVRRQLGRRLRTLRVSARKTTVAVEESKIVSRTTLHKIENGHQRVTVAQVMALCDFYQVPRVTTQALVALAKATTTTGWFERYGDVVPASLELLLSAEQLASTVTVYDPEIIPGLLQVPDYTRGLFQEEDRRRSPELIERLLAARVARLDRFWASHARNHGKRVTAVINEGALARRVGDDATMKLQVEHLRELDGQGAADVRILEFRAGAHPAIYGGFWIFDFVDPDDPSVGYLETYAGGQYVEEPDEISRLRDIQARTSRAATPIKEYEGHALHDLDQGK